MQVVRMLLMLFGVALIVVGLYLLVLGFGAPVAIEAVELGSFKASMKGIGSGAFVAVVGLGLIWVAGGIKKTVTRRTTTTTSGEDGVDGPKIITTIEETVTQLAPPN